MTEQQVMRTFWPAMVGIGIGAEAYALMRDSGNLTLSSYVWQARDTGNPIVKRSAIGIVCLYLGVHFLFGGK